MVIGRRHAKGLMKLHERGVERSTPISNRFPKVGFIVAVVRLATASDAPWLTMGQSIGGRKNEAQTA